SDAIFVHDPQTGAVLDVNRKACEIHGYSREELAAMGLSAITGKTDEFTQGKALEFIRKAAAGQPQCFEWQSVNRAGEPVWVEVALNGVTILGEDRVLANVRNIHQRKTAEEALRHANEELEVRVDERTAELQAANQELVRRTEELEGIFLALPDLYFRLSA